jgi:hypothetical protein
MQLKVAWTVIALSVLAVPLKAQAKVWYCEMTGSVDATESGEQKYNLEKFKFKITQETIEFGQGGYFDGDIIPVTTFLNSSQFVADDRGQLRRVLFVKGKFSFASLKHDKALAIFALCDDF